MLSWDAFYNYYPDFKNQSNSSNERERKRTFVKTFVKKNYFILNIQVKFILSL